MIQVGRLVFYLPDTLKARNCIRVLLFVCKLKKKYIKLGLSDYSICRYLDLKVENKMARTFKRNRPSTSSYHRKLNSKRTNISRTQTKQTERKRLVKKANQFIKNLSNYNLSDFEILALGKGLNFIPNPEKPR